MTFYSHWKYPFDIIDTVFSYYIHNFKAFKPHNLKVHIHFYPIYYRIVQEHHGKISVESEVGKGTTFTVKISTDLQKRLAKAEKTSK